MPNYRTYRPGTNVTTLSKVMLANAAVIIELAQQKLKERSRGIDKMNSSMILMQIYRKAKT